MPPPAAAQEGGDSSNRSAPIQTPGPAPALAPSPVEEKEKLIAMPVVGRCSSGTVRVSPSATAAGDAGLSCVASTVEERDKLAQAHVTGTRNFVSEKALPSVTAEGDAGLSGAASTVEEREQLVLALPPLWIFQDYWVTRLLYNIVFVPQYDCSWFGYGTIALDIKGPHRRYVL